MPEEFDLPGEFDRDPLIYLLASTLSPKGPQFLFVSTAFSSVREQDSREPSRRIILLDFPQAGR
jgi:hypothetical protein